MSDLIPWNRINRLTIPREHDPVVTLRYQLNRLFDQTFTNPLNGRESLENLSADLNSFSPKVDVRETGEEVIISVELPEMDEKNIKIFLFENSMKISGTKEKESTDKGTIKKHIPVKRA